MDVPREMDDAFGHRPLYDNFKAVEYRFEQANNTYYIPKYYPDWAKKNGIAVVMTNT